MDGAQGLEPHASQRAAAGRISRGARQGQRGAISLGRRRLEALRAWLVHVRPKFDGDPSAGERKRSTHHPAFATVRFRTQLPLSLNSLREQVIE
jgi:hypothetical protein